VNKSSIRQLCVAKTKQCHKTKHQQIAKTFRLGQMLMLTPKHIKLRFI